MSNTLYASFKNLYLSRVPSYELHKYLAFFVTYFPELYYGTVIKKLICSTVGIVLSTYIKFSKVNYQKKCFIID